MRTPKIAGSSTVNPRFFSDLPIYKAIYRGPMTPFATFVGAHLVVLDHYIHLQLRFSRL